MLKQKLCSVLLIVMATFVFASNGLAYSTGWIDTDRFGYEGTITRYTDLTMTNSIDSVATGARDASIYSVNFEDDLYSIIMGSWWYSTTVNPATGSPVDGWGNVNGNTGQGFMQYYDESQVYVVDQDYSFTDFDGTYWTTFNFNLDVEMDENGASSRLSAPSNVKDSGFFHNLNVTLSATGLQGIYDNGMIIASESDGFPTGVTGSISGLFENTSSDASNNGFYGFNFTLNMENWAYENREILIGSNAYNTFREGSYAAPVPEPGTAALLGMGLLGLAGYASRRRR
jgi:hypothetical protein